MLFQMAAMSCDDGLVMQIHPGVLRNHHSGVAAALRRRQGLRHPGAGRVHPRRCGRCSRRFGHDRVVPDRSSSPSTRRRTRRELAPLAGAYPSVRLGAPWWFLDSPDGMRRFREAATETAGFYNTSGFVDDTRAFASIPARHDLARRIDAGYLARLVAEHRLDEDEAAETAVDLAYNLPKLAYQRRRPLLTPRDELPRPQAIARPALDHRVSAAPDHSPRARCEEHHACPA